MPPVRTYETDAAYKVALENRVKEAAKKKGMHPNRYRQLVVFDRFLGRLDRQFGNTLILPRHG